MHIHTISLELQSPVCPSSHTYACHTYAYIHMHTYICMHIHTISLELQSPVCPSSHTYACHTYAYIHMHTYTCMHIHTISLELQSPVCPLFFYFLNRCPISMSMRMPRRRVRAWFYSNRLDGRGMAFLHVFVCAYVNNESAPCSAW